MTAWFDSLASWYSQGQMPVVLFSFADVFRSIVWPALALYLPFVVVTAVALWAVSLVFGTRRT